VWSVPWRDRVDLFVGARSAAVACRRARWPVNRGRDVDAAPGGFRVVEAADAVEQASQWLASHAAPGAQVDVVFSDELVRYAWARGAAILRQAAQRDAAAAGSLNAVYGDAAHEWAAVLGVAGARNEDAVACGIDRTRLAATLEALARVRLRVRSARPMLAHAWEVARRDGALPDAGWFVVLEPGRAALAAFDAHGWRMARSQRLRDARELPSMIEQARLAADLGEMPGEVLVACQDADARVIESMVSGPAWRFASLASFAPAPEAFE
jgi:hypothetical protein